MGNQLTEKMSRGEPVIGTFSHIGSGTAIECLGLCGLDFVVIDTEHGPFSVQDAMDYIRAAEIRGMAPVVRVQDYSRPSLHKALNCGAKAIIIPCMERVEEIRALVDQGKFYPKGQHCFPYARNACWGTDSGADLVGFFNRNNESTLLVPQCETQGFLDNIEEIIRIDGIDGVFVGPFDLTTAMGIPGQFNDSRFIAARARILKACKDAGKFAWIFSPNAEAAKNNLADGFDGTAVSMDTVVFMNGFRALLEQIKS